MRKANHPFLNDQKAAEIISRMDYDFSAFDRVWMSYYGVLARAKLMDREVKRFMADNPGMCGGICGLRAGYPV